MKVFYVSLMHCLLQNVLARVKSIIVSETFLKHQFGAIDFNTQQTCMYVLLIIRALTEERMAGKPILWGHL